MLRNFDYAIKYFDFRFKAEMEITSNPAINGWYKFINGVLSALFVQDSRIYFLFGDNKFLITGFHRVLVELATNAENKFCLSDGDDVLVEFIYSKPTNNFNYSPFEYIDEVDNDWGFFIARIVNDEARKGNFIANLTNTL